MSLTTILFAEGFEGGDITIIPSVDRSGGSVVAGGAHSSSYRLEIGNWASQYIEFQIAAQTEVYLSFYKNMGNNWDNIGSVYFYLTDGTNMEMRWSSSRYNLYRNGTSINSGAYPVPDNNWHNYQVYLKIDDAAGIFQVKLDGGAYMNDFSGDTKPSTGTQVNKIRFSNSGAGGVSDRFDSIVCGTGGWPGDMRVDGLLPNADGSTEEWSLSTGSDSYALVDERPPSETDYIYSATNGQKTFVAVENWTATNKTIMAVKQAARAWKGSANGHQLKLLASLDEITIDTGSALDLVTSATQYSRLLSTAPDGGAWNPTKVNDLKIGVESVII